MPFKEILFVRMQDGSSQRDSSLSLYFCRMNEVTGEGGKTGWPAVEALLQARFGKLPDMEGILFLIGINEYGRGPKREKFTKEQKCAPCSASSIITAS